MALRRQADLGWCSLVVVTIAAGAGADSLVFNGAVAVLTPPPWQPSLVVLVLTLSTSTANPERHHSDGGSDSLTD